MLLLSYYQLLRQELCKVYEEREAGNIAAIVLEEYCQIANPQESNKVLSDTQISDLEIITRRLQQNEPWQYVLGVADFYGLKWKVDANVLIPRPETEELVQLIHRDYRQHPKTLRILDIGTGSGCIAVTLAHLLPQAQVQALDQSEGALVIAQENARQHQTNVQFFALDFLDVVQTAQLPAYDIIVSNPPYITHQERDLMGKNVLAYEPKQALFVTNNDPLQFYRAMAVFAQKHLERQGRIYAEINPLYAAELSQCWSDAGLKNIEILPDFYGQKRMARANY